MKTSAQATGTDALGSRWLAPLGFRVHAREGGSGDPVVLVHGLGVSGRYFEPLGRELLACHRVLIPDLPGWGLSERPPRALDLEQAADVLAALTGAEAVAPTIVANSLGCQIVLRLAVRPAARLGPLVLIGPTVDPRYRGWSRQAAQLLLDAVREPASLWPLVARDYSRMGTLRLLSTARAALADRPELRLPAVAQPLLVVRGERDAVTTLDWAKRCAAVAPHGTFVSVPGAAHAAHVSHPRLVSTLIELFLAKHSDRVT